jgi:PhzF family phenazine biosynthesis protein
MYQVDAFSRRILAGNPAAVCPLPEWLPDGTMQALALENNLSETAFLVPQHAGRYHLRWFTPTTEVDLCGHATLASAFVIWNCLGDRSEPLRFDTRSGPLTVARQNERVAMYFPAARVEACSDAPPELAAGLGSAPLEVFTVTGTGTYLPVFDSEDAVRGLDPDFRLLKRLGKRSVNPTSPGIECDFVSRYFAPSFGIDEDPVTGSAHCALVPFWADRLGKSRLHARQVSTRGGDLYCERLSDTVVIAGDAALYMEATIHF